MENDGQNYVAASTDAQSELIPTALIAKSEISVTQPESSAAEEAVQTDTEVETQSVVQLTLSGDSLQKFARILNEKKLISAEDAIEYFFNLHQKNLTDCDKPPDGVSSSVSSSASTVKVSSCKPAPPKVSSGSPPQDDVDDTEHGTVVVSGVRKSKRKRVNPLSKTDDFVSARGKYPYNRVGGDRNVEPHVIYLGPPKRRRTQQNPPSPPTDIIIDNASDISEDIDIGGSDDDGVVYYPKRNFDTKDLRVIDLGPPSKKTSKDGLIIITPDSEKGKAGRPKKRKQVAVLFDSERESKKCAKCSEQFQTFSELEKHKVEKHGRPGHPYFCEECDYTAQFECDMKRHQLVHVKDKLYKCEICNFETNWIKNYELHKANIHNEKEPWRCDRCDVEIHNQSKVRQHLLSHNPNALKCTECPLLFDKEPSLRTHIKTQHTPDESKNFECQLCDFTTMYRSILKSHQHVKHNMVAPTRQPRQRRTVKCDICNKLLVSKEQLEVHKQIHEEDNRDSEKPYYCRSCDSRSSDLNQMVRHWLIHTEERPFACEHCSYRTRWKKDLKVHGLIHSGEKTVHCPHCNYSCYTRQRLRTHLIKHDNTRRHVCGLCHMSFKSKQALRMHTMYHTGEAQFSCDLCEFKTVTEMRLRKHKLRHTDERNYACDLCGKRFKQAHHVTQHRDIVHLGKPSYREKKRIALQQSAAEALGNLNPSEFTQTIVMNEDGTTTIVDLQGVGPSLSEGQQVIDEPTQYVMVETPAGYQYVAVVVPDSTRITLPPEQNEETPDQNAEQQTLEEHPQVFMASDTVMVDDQTTSGNQHITAYYTPSSDALNDTSNSIVYVQPNN